MIRLGILGSTRGTNMQAILDAIHAKQLLAQIKIVISNKADALILQRAADNQLSHCFIDPIGLDRETYDRQVSNELQHHQVDLIVLIGYMRILSAEFISVWRHKIINVHPSLLPAYAGMMDLEVHRAVLQQKEKQTGCTVHYVTEKVDAGPILLKKTCHVLPDDTAESLKERVQALEACALVEAINDIHTR
jgi:phosphoribosylglycinamide formyltransferase-1